MRKSRVEISPRLRAGREGLPSSGSLQGNLHSLLPMGIPWSYKGCTCKPTTHGKIGTRKKWTRSLPFSPAGLSVRWIYSLKIIDSLTFFLLSFKKVSYLLHPTSFRFESRATHINEDSISIYRWDRDIYLSEICNDSGMNGYKWYQSQSPVPMNTWLNVLYSL